MKKLTNYTLIISLLIIFSDCKKHPSDPCEGLLNESPPLKIGILLYDKTKGENLVLAKPIGDSDIKITELQKGNTINNWRLVKAPGSPLNGMLEIAAFHEKAGQCSYKVEIKGLGSVVIGYIISQEKSDNPCRTYFYPLTELKSTGHDFEQFIYQDKRFPNVIKVFIL